MASQRPAKASVGGSRLAGSSPAPSAEIELYGDLFMLVDEHQAIVGEDSIDRLRSLSEAAEERAVEEFKERLRSDAALDAMYRARGGYGGGQARRVSRVQIEAAIEAAEEEAS